MTRYRCSLYFDVEAETKDDALNVAKNLEAHLSRPDDYIDEGGYFNPFIGGVASMQELFSGKGDI